MPVEDTAEVKEAKAVFYKAFEAAENREHAKLKLVPAPVVTKYVQVAAPVAAPVLYSNAIYSHVAQPYAVHVPAAPAAPEDTADVKEAKAMFYKAFEEAEKGEHAKLAPAPVMNAYLPDAPEVAAAKPYLADDAAVAAAKPYLADAPEVAAAKPYLADTPAVAAAKPYLADDAAVAAAKPYVADDADVVAAKADFMKYFDARKAGIPATPGSLEPVQVAAPVAAPVSTVYSNPIYNYALPYTYNNWGYSGLSPYYYTNTYYNAPLTYAAYPTVAVAKEVKHE